jgi:hypothetical protein
MSNVIDFPKPPPLPIDPDNIVDLDFGPVPAFRARSQEQRAANTLTLSKRVYHAAGVAVELLSLTKLELIEVMRTRDGQGLLDELDAAVTDAETLGGFYKHGEQSGYGGDRLH